MKIAEIKATALKSIEPWAKYPPYMDIAVGKLLYCCKGMQPVNGKLGTVITNSIIQALLWAIPMFQ